MDTNKTRRKINASPSQLSKAKAMQILKDEKETRAKVRDRIKNGTLKEVPT
ncbi:MAG: hypothetical protein JJW00_07065 [Sulfurimonas sp.]|nr:hypothetical protein [Sulfurimonas sp.]